MSERRLYMRRFIMLVAAISAFAVIAATQLVSSAAAAQVTCQPTGFMRDNINLTAAQIGGNVTGTLDASGANTVDGVPCNIGVYYDNTTSGNVSAGADISGANYFGVVVNGDVGAVSVNVKGGSIHDIGESPLAGQGSQHGTAVYYRGLGAGSATGTVSGNTITNYQKGGITVSGNVLATITGNTVTGQGPVSWIAQNGIQMGYGAKGSVTGNTVTGNAYTGTNFASSGGILVVGGPFFGLPYTTGLTISKNTLTGNDVGVWLFNANESGTLRPPRPTTASSSTRSRTVRSPTSAETAPKRRPVDTRLESQTWVTATRSSTTRSAAPATRQWRATATEHPLPSFGSSTRTRPQGRCPATSERTLRPAPQLAGKSVN